MDNEREAKRTARAADPPGSVPSRRAWVGCWLGVLAIYGMLLAGSFPARNPNELSRIQLSLALAESGTIQIDRVAETYGPSQDHSVREGRHYSDKAPGLSFLATPVAWVMQRALPTSADGPHPVYWPLRHVLTGIVIALPASLFPFLILRAFSSVSPSIQIVTAVLIALVSPMLTYSTMFFGHVPAGLLGSLGFLLAIVPGPSRGALSGRRSIFSGMLIGLATATEYPCALFGLVAVIMFLVRRTSFKHLLAFCGGGLIFAVPLLLYHQSAFGSMWTTGYAFKSQGSHAAMHAVGFFGISVPTVEGLLGVLFSPMRGMMFYCPVLILAAVGVRVMGQRRASDGWAFGTVFVLFVLFAAGFRDWDGGWCAAARHLVPILPLACVPLAEGIAVASRRTWSGILLLILAGASLCAALLSVTVTPYFPEFFPSPLAQVAMRSLSQGAAAPTLLSVASPLSSMMSMGLLAICAVVQVGWVLGRMITLPGRRMLGPAFLCLGGVLFAVGLWAFSPTPDDNLERWRAYVLRRCGHADLADEIQSNTKKTGGSPQDK